MTSIRDTEPEPPDYGNELKLTFNTEPRHVVAWLEHHGHRGWYASHQRYGADASGALIFDHGPGTEVQMARPGDTLTVRPNGTIDVS